MEYFGHGVEELPTRREWKKSCQRAATSFRVIERSVAVARDNLSMTPEVMLPLNIDYPRQDLKRTGRIAVYVVSTKEMFPSKIGVASDIITRMSALQVGYWECLHLYFALWFPGKDMALAVEKSVRVRLHDENIRGEWFRINPTDAKKIINEEAARFTGRAKIIDHSVMIELLHRCGKRKII